MANDAATHGTQGRGLRDHINHQGVSLADDERVPEEQKITVEFYAHAARLPKSPFRDDPNKPLRNIGRREGERVTVTRLTADHLARLGVIKVDDNGAPLDVGEAPKRRRRSAAEGE